MKKLTVILTLCAALFVCAPGAFAAADVAALMYHSVTNDEQRWDDYTISPAQLDADITYFTDCGYITMTATELAEADMSQIDGKKILLLTFDDGYSNFYTDIFPVLKKHGAKATMFLIGSYIDRYGYLTSDQVYEMANSTFVEIGNHTDNLHSAPREILQAFYNNPDLHADVLRDIRENGELLSRITGKKITSMSWPYGLYAEELDGALKNNLGYKISFSTDFDVNKFSGSLRTPLNRMNREYSASTQDVFDRANGKF